MMTHNTGIDQRSGLPDDLRVLLLDYPKDQWRAHQNFSGALRHWLDQHHMFCKSLHTLQSESQYFVDGARAPDRYATLITHVGGFLISELQSHQKFEDEQYFPRLAKLDNRLTTGFAMLEQDHRQMDTVVQDTWDTGQTLISQIRTNSEAAIMTADRLLRVLKTFEHLLNRHLIDEEELVVPVILAYNPDIG